MITNVTVFSSFDTGLKRWFIFSQFFSFSFFFLRVCVCVQCFHWIWNYGGHCNPRTGIFMGHFLIFWVDWKKSNCFCYSEMERTQQLHRGISIYNFSLWLLNDCSCHCLSIIRIRPRMANWGWHSIGWRSNDCSNCFGGHLIASLLCVDACWLPPNHHNTCCSFQIVWYVCCHAD